MRKLYLIQKVIMVLTAGSLMISSCGVLKGPKANENPGSPQNPSNQVPTPKGPMELPTSEPSPIPPAAVKILVSQKARVENPQVDPATLGQVANGNTAFAIDLYQKLRGQDGNLFFSPYSISLALAMTYAGARGQSEKQMADTMHFALSGDQLHAALNSLDQQLASLAKEQLAEGGEPFQLSIANSLWGQDGFPFLPAFLDILGQNYGAGMRETDFAQAPESARQAINDWVSQQTQEKIKDLFPPGTIDQNTRLALANAIYFKASWETPFTPSSTQNKPFYLLDKSIIDVPMMSAPLQNQMLYYKSDGYQAALLPYAGNQVRMVVVLPDEGKYNQVEESLTAGELLKIVASVRGTSIQFSMPKFKIESSFSLADILQAMGMKDAFVPELADFSGMDGKKDLYISSVVHKAYVNVDEKGTEAAAATGVAMGLSAMPQEPLRLTLNRPFLFFIQDATTGTVLFAGRVLNPAQ